MYDKIVIFSPTFKTQYDILWHKISSEGVTVHENLSEIVLSRIYTDQLANPEVKSLIISDDEDEQWRRGIDSRLVNKIMTNSRHCNLSFIFLSQKLTQLPTVVRSQLDCLCVFAASSFLELDSLWRECSTLPKKQFMEIFATVTSKPYHFLAICTVQGKLKLFDCLVEEIIVK